MPGAPAGAAASGGRAAGGAAKKTTAKKTAPAKRAPAKKTAAKKTAPAKRAPAKKTAAPPSTQGSSVPEEIPPQTEETEETTEAPGRDYLAPLDHSVTQTGAGIVLGIVGYAILVNYLKGGAPQVKKWLKAKFLNDAADKPNLNVPGKILGGGPTGPGGGAAGGGIKK